MKIVIRPTWTFMSESGETVDPKIFVLLGAVHDKGKLTLAASKARLSYRHAWNLLKKWSQFFGSQLVEMQRGIGAQLTPLGAKLLWAEQRSGASLFPQLENIASELNREINHALKDTRPIIRVHASHGYAVEKLSALMSRLGYADVDLQYMGSMVALESLARSSCDLAGFHVPLGDLGASLWGPYAERIKPHLRIIRLVIRTQGLMVAKDNPLDITSLTDLTRPEIRFVNRQRGSGTRIVLDGLLSSLSLDSGSIRGYESSEFTHAAVAAFVASGMADAGFGVEPAARQFKLDFLPMVKERYMLVGRKESLRQAPISELIALLKGEEFRAMMRDVPGYALNRPGEVVTVQEAFPWLDAPGTCNIP